MFNQIAFNNSLIVAAATTTVNLGTGPGLTTPPQLLVSNASGALTINLPPISSTQPQPPTTAQAVVGVAGGYRITIFNASGNAITITPNGTDSTLPTAVVASSANAITTLQAVEGTSTWYKVA